MLKERGILGWRKLVTLPHVTSEYVRGFLGAVPGDWGPGLIYQALERGDSVSELPSGEQSYEDYCRSKGWVEQGDGAWGPPNEADQPG